MDDDVTRFTAIKGIGKRTDARLHEAGVATWHSLAEVLMALSTIREASSERLGDMGRQAAKRASRTRDGATTEARDVERPHGFVVEITFDPSGGALRSSVTDVRAGRGQQWAGWEPASLISFIEQRTGLDGSPATAPARPARAVRSRRPAAQRPRPAAKRAKRAERAGPAETGWTSRTSRAGCTAGRATDRDDRRPRPDDRRSTTDGRGRGRAGRPGCGATVELWPAGHRARRHARSPRAGADRRAGPGADVRGHDGAGAHPRVPQRGHPCWHPQPRGRARGQGTGRRRRPDRPRRPGGVSGVTRRRRSRGVGRLSGRALRPTRWQRRAGLRVWPQGVGMHRGYVEATVLMSWSAGLEGSHNVGNSSSGRNPDASQNARVFA